MLQRQGKASWNKSSAQTINACICKRTQERGSVRRILLETASAFPYKKHANVKTFIGTSENALRIQIWTVMISLLIIRWLHHLSKMKWSFSVMSAMLRLNLFTYRPLPEWLDRPYETPPAVPVPEQQLIFN